MEGLHPHFGVPRLLFKSSSGRSWVYKTTLDEGLQHLDVHKSLARETHQTHTSRMHGTHMWAAA